MSLVLFTDFGAGLYVGQVKAVLAEHASQVPVIDLLHDAPAFDIASSAHLLAACLPRFAAGSIFLAIVDPGVGTERDAVVVSCDGRYLVGPDNGLLSVCAARAARVQCWTIAWRPRSMSVSFHGRDLFAPVAAAMAAGPWPDDRLFAKARLDVELDAGDLAAVIYVDHYGNACTGVRAASLSRGTALTVSGRRIDHAAVFGAVEPGSLFWYENSLGLVEIAANRTSAAHVLGLAPGVRIGVG